MYPNCFNIKATWKDGDTAEFIRMNPKETISCIISLESASNITLIHFYADPLDDGSLPCRCFTSSRSALTYLVGLL